MGFRITSSGRLDRRTTFYKGITSDRVKKIGKIILIIGGLVLIIALFF